MEKRDKKLELMVLLSVVLAVLIGSVSSAQADVSGNYNYTVSNGKATITGYTGTATAISIPSTVGGYPVRAIGESAFEDSENLKSVTIPNGVTNIGRTAFSFCENLTSVAVPSSVTSIGNHAFRFCSSLTNITLPKGLTSIAEGTFLWCSSLASITIPDNVTSIGNYAFSFCDSLTSVTIPAKVTSMGKRPFGFCSSLASISVTSGNTAFRSINGILYDKSMQLLLAYPAGKNASSFSIPSGVTSICNAAFSCGDHLTSVTIPNSVTSIGYEAFRDCNGLSSISIPNSVASIDDYAFAECDQLARINISSSVTSLGQCVFVWSYDLTSINVASGNTVYASANGILYNKSMKTLVAYPQGKSNSFVIPSNVTKIGDTAFFGSNVIDITLTDSVTSIGDRAFEWCEGLTGITIPDSVMSIGEYAFSDCDSLTIHGYAGSYVQTYAQDNGISFEAMPVEPLSITSVTADKTSVNTGSDITWTATATGGSGTKTYRFKLYKDGIVIVGGTYGFANTYKYTPTEAGTYKVRTYVMDSTSTVTKESADVIVKEPLSITGVTSDTTNTVTDSAITWTATATGGSGAKTYRFKLYKDGAEFIGGTYGSASTFKYTPTETGIYKVRVYVKDSTGIVTKDSANVIVNKPLSITGVTADKTSANIGTAITWTETATGGIGTKNYRFLVYKDGTVLTSSKYTTSATYKYTPIDAGTYRVRAYVKDSTGEVSLKSADVTVKAPLTITSVNSNVSSIDAGSEITWTAAATGGSGTKTYRFKLYKDDIVIVGGTYGSANTYRYTPTEIGIYKVRVYVKDDTGIKSKDSADVNVK